MVRLGHINYLNCLPVHGAIILKKIPFDGEIIEGPPSFLNKLLYEGKLDVSPSSSFEIIKGYRVIPNLSISSKREVRSIILLTKNDLFEIKRGKFFITSHSQTSVMLLKLILKEFINIESEFFFFDPDKEDFLSLLTKADGILYIGDYALKKFSHPTLFKYDLAYIWYEYTGLPFTFALWQVSKKSEKNTDIKLLKKSLYESYQFFLNHKNYLAEVFSAKMEFEKEFILNYWDSLSFELAEDHIKSLKLFFKLLKKNDFIDKEPEIIFFD